MAELETKKSSFFLKFLFLIALALLAVIAQSLIRETYKKNQIRREIETLEKQAQAIDRENFEVEERLAYLESEEYKKKEAKDKLGLRDPGEFVVFVKPRVSQENNSTQEEIPAEKTTAIDASAISNPMKWWQYFFN